jgi:hypothetical protein
MLEFKDIRDMTFVIIFGALLGFTIGIADMYMFTEFMWPLLG